MSYVYLKDILDVKTGKYDANHAKKNGKYKFFTCALEPSWTDTYSFEDEVIILPGNGANVGEVLYYKGKLEAYQRTYILHSINVHVKYLYYFLKKEWRKQTNKMQVGSATNYIKLDNILSFQIPLPPLEQQKEIAEKLDTADLLRKKDQELLAQYDELTQAIFIDMFGDPVQNEKGWEVEKLNVVAPFKKYDGKINETNNKFWLLNLDMVVSHTGEIINKYWVERSEINNSTITFNEEQVLYSKLRPYLNKVVLPDISGYATSELVPLNPRKDKLNRYFLCHLLRSSYFVKYIEEKVAGAKMPRVNMDTLRDYKVILPPISLQNQFTEKIKNIETQKALAKKQAQESEDLFQALLQESFNFNS